MFALWPNKSGFCPANMAYANASILQGYPCSVGYQRGSTLRAKNSHVSFSRANTLVPVGTKRILFAKSTPRFFGEAGSSWLRSAVANAGTRWNPEYDRLVNGRYHSLHATPTRRSFSKDIPIQISDEAQIHKISIYVPRTNQISKQICSSQ